MTTAEEIEAALLLAIARDDVPQADRAAALRFAAQAAESARAAMALVTPPEVDTTPPRRAAPALDPACALLRELLPRDGQAHLATPIIERMVAAGFSRATIFRARVKLGIEAPRIRERHARSTWRWRVHNSDTAAAA